ncbi:MAG: hypothetical protein NZ108_09935, partial [Bacteroidia bacterium]|nr:hypothetical protein [Bacteroidia bacterium]
EEPIVILDSLNQDTLYHCVQDVWTYQYPYYLGTFDPPIEVPVLYKERTKYLFSGGVYENDKPNLHKRYPFWKFDETELVLTEKETKQYRPVFRYYSDSILVFPFQENFENSEIRFQIANSTTDTARLVRATGGFKGFYCGEVRFDSTHRFLDVQSIIDFLLPRENTEVWGEITYQSDIPFLIELGQSSLYLTASPNQWKTSFLNFTSIARTNPEGTRFRFGIYANAQGNPAKIRLDNIRILYFR